MRCVFLVNFSETIFAIFLEAVCVKIFKFSKIFKQGMGL